MSQDLKIVRVTLLHPTFRTTEPSGRGIEYFRRRGESGLIRVTLQLPDDTRLDVPTRRLPNVQFSVRPSSAIGFCVVEFTGPAVEFILGGLLANPQQPASKVSRPIVNYVEKNFRAVPTQGDAK